MSAKPRRAERSSTPPSASATRVIVYTGKGGVGKTTVSAATALALAKSGQRTLVTSTDPAHSLADAFGMALGSDPTEVAPLCFAQEADPLHRMANGWDDIRAYLVDILHWAGAEAIEADELAVLPGLEEVLALADLHDAVESGEWDAVVVDCAPTAETLRLLSLPDVLSWYMDRAFPVSRRLTRLVRPALSRLTEIPVADDAVFDSAERLYSQLRSVRALLTEADRTSVRVVVVPEEMVVAEARRTFTYLSLFGYRVDAVVANRILPDEVVDPYFRRWQDQQRAHLRTITDGFGGVPVWRVGLAAGEVVGVTALSAVADEVFRGVDPQHRRQGAPPLRIVSEDDSASRAALELDLPFADRSDVDVAIAEGDVIVTCGPYRRVISLPDSLRHHVVERAALTDGVLRIVMSPSESAVSP